LLSGFPLSYNETPSLTLAQARLPSHIKREEGEEEEALLLTTMAEEED